MDIDKTFKYNPPFGTQPARYIALRAAAKQFAELVKQECPESREKSLALTSIQQSVMWANAAIAINETPVE
jgi:hypothetical protein